MFKNDVTFVLDKFLSNIAFHQIFFCYFEMVDHEKYSEAALLFPTCFSGSTGVAMAASEVSRAIKLTFLWTCITLGS